MVYLSISNLIEVWELLIWSASFMKFQIYHFWKVTCLFWKVGNNWFFVIYFWTTFLLGQFEIPHQEWSSPYKAQPNWSIWLIWSCSLSSQPNLIPLSQKGLNATKYPWVKMGCLGLGCVGWWGGGLCCQVAGWLSQSQVTSGCSSTQSSFDHVINIQYYIICLCIWSKPNWEKFVSKPR